jgi:tetratricopeptide (TPR) repeat protein
VLDSLGRNNEARDAYIEVIKRDGTHVGALGNLGTLLYNAGYRSAARLIYNEALKYHPRDLRTLINLANALLENNERALPRDPRRQLTTAVVRRRAQATPSGARGR